MPRETAAVSAQVLCTPYNHAPVYSVTAFNVIYVGCMYVRQGACMFGCNLPHARLAKRPGYFTCYCGNTGVDHCTGKSVSHILHHRRCKSVVMFPDRDFALPAVIQFVANTSVKKQT